jgi:Flp pilus assembly protein TadD
MRLSAVSHPFLCGSLLIAALPALAQTDPVNYLKEIERAMQLSRTRNDPGAAIVLESALADAAKNDKSEWRATLLGFLGPVYQRTGRFEEAEASLNKSISLWAQMKGDDGPELVAPLGNLGALYFDAGQYARAERLIFRAVELGSKSGLPSKALATLRTNLGSVYFAEHKDVLATEEGEKALRESRSLDAGTAWDYSLLGALHLRAGRNVEAESCMDQALAIWKARLAPTDPHVAAGLANLATFYSVTNQLTRAETLFRKAAEILQLGGSDEAYVRQSYAEYASVEKRLGHKKEARRLEKEVAKLGAVSAEAVLSRQIIDVNAFK